MDLGGSGWIWMDLGGSGWIWVDLSGSGWIWVDLSGSEWIWMDLECSLLTKVLILAEKNVNKIKLTLIIAGRCEKLSKIVVKRRGVLIHGRKKESKGLGV